MSRVSAPPAPTGMTSAVKVPHEKIAMRAYEKWCKKGRPCGTDKQDWIEAENELKAEMSRTGAVPSTTRR
jgi:hypothetical protein